ncbi:MAG TPA: hypothetical protein DFI00_04630 [Rhodospirillaceae bacterium]|nr:hypothetical protein [Rhodospirillaceae bacterium]|tara:strand:- start:4321 stop:5517 length:1197 start_codon:yes stop_codon:yes gene_type:complete
MARISGASKALPSILVIVVCLGIASTAGMAFRQAKSWGCPCGASAAMVQLTGLTITGYVETWIAWTYILLANNFSALNAQINGNTQVNVETDSYQTMVKAQADRSSMSFTQSLANTESPDDKFQATVASVAGGVEATTYSTNKAIMEQNIEWLRGLDETTANTTAANARKTIERQQQLYCGEREAELGLCEAVDAELQNAHTRAESIYEYSVLSEKFRNAAIDFCRALIGSNPTVDYPTSEAPRESVKYQDRETRDARMALSLGTCQHLVALRAEVSDGEIAAWAETMRKLISGQEGGVPDYLSDLSPDATGSSFLEVLGFASKYRLSNPKWMTHTHTIADPTAVLKQIVAIRATRMMIKWQRFELHQYNAAMIATIQAAESQQRYETNTGRISEANF